MKELPTPSFDGRTLLALPGRRVVRRSHQREAARLLGRQPILTTLPSRAGLSLLAMRAQVQRHEATESTDGGKDFRVPSAG